MQHAIVDDQDLGVDVDRPARRGDRMVEPEAAVGVGVAQHLDEAGPGGIHGDRLEPAMGLLGVDQHDFRPVGLGQPLAPSPRRCGATAKYWLSAKI